MHPISNRIVKLLTHSSKRPIGAILLHGTWGCGKTYLWKNEIEPALSNEKEIPSIYVSLFGTASLEEIRTKLTSAWFRQGALGQGKMSDLFEKIDVLKDAPIIQAGMTVLFKALKDKTGIEIAPFKVDLLPFIKEQTIICFDDIERASINSDIILGFINFLVEHKKCRVLIIANEEKLKLNEKMEQANLYDIYKEKVIWTSLSFMPTLETIYEILIADLEEGSTKDKITESKNEILEIFRIGRSKNVRTLQRALRFVEEVFDRLPINLPEGDLRFLVALIIEDAERGLLDKEKYNSYKMAAMSYRDQRKISELKGEDKIAYDFYQRFHEGRPSIRQSQAIYDFVKYGTLDDKALSEEIIPKEKQLTEDQILLKEANETDWVYGRDVELINFLKKIVEFLSSDRLASAYESLMLTARYCEYCEFLGQVGDSNVIERVKDRLQFQAKGQDSSLDRPVIFETKIQMEKIGPLLDFFKQEKDRGRTANASNIINEWFKSGDHKFGIPDLDFDKNLLEAAIADNYLDQADEAFISKPIVFHTYYRIIIKALSDGAPELSIELKNDALYKIRARLKKHESPNLEKTAQWRLDDLSRRIRNPPLSPGVDQSF